MKFQSWFDYLLLVTVIVKVIFIISSLFIIGYKIKGKNDDPLALKISYWKERFEFIFIFNMSLILIYVFYPRRSKPLFVEKETRLLLFLYGVITIVTAKWDLFFQESPLLYQIQRTVGGNYFKKQDMLAEEEEKMVAEKKKMDVNISNSEQVNKIQDAFREMNNNYNAGYQNYYSNIYTPDTIGAIAVKNKPAQKTQQFI